MGVKDLMNLLKSKCPEVLHKNAMKPIEGDFWVDTPLIVMAAIKKAEVSHENPIQLAKLSIHRVFKQIKGIRREAKIHWVFDGGSREEKKDTCLQRQKNAEAFTKRCIEKQNAEIESHFVLDSCLDDDLDMATLIVQQNEQPEISTRQVYEVVKDYVLRFGEIHIAKHDSEEFIARNMDISDVAVTSDSDALPFGCSTIVQHFGSDKETWIYIEQVLEMLKLRMETFQELCILLGTDFNPRLKGCGPVKCFTSITQASFSLEKFAEDNQGTQEWLDQANLALRIFQGI